MKDVTRRTVLQGTAAAAAAMTVPLAPTPAAAQAKTTIRVALSATNVNSLDMRKSIQNADQFCSRQIFDALLDPPDGTFRLGYDEVMLELVEKWELSADSKTWTLKLKEGVLFHGDNGELTSDDVKFTFDQMLDPKWASTLRAFLSDLDRVEAPEKYVVKFVLKQPNPTFHAAALISLVGSVVPRKAFEAAPDKFSRNPIGSGPFVFAGIEPDRGVVLNAFDKYHGGRPKIDTVEVRYMVDPTARTLSFVKGELDIIEGARLPGWVEQVKQQRPDAIVDQTRPGSCNTFFFNLGKKPFDDIRVRKALRYGINRDIITTAFGGPTGIAGLAWGVNPPEFPGGLKETDVPEELRYYYDPKKAKALLTEAGFGSGLKFSIIMTQREDYASLMLMIQDMWREIGVDMTINTVDHTTYHAQKAKDVNAIVLNSETFAPVPTQMLSTCYAASSTVKADGSGLGNFSHYGEKIPGIDDLLGQALAEPVLAKRQELVRRAELKVLQDMPAFTLCTLSFVFLRNPRVNLGYDVSAGYPRLRLANATVKK